MNELEESLMKLVSERPCVECRWLYVTDWMNEDLIETEWGLVCPDCYEEMVKEGFIDPVDGLKLFRDMWE